MMTKKKSKLQKSIFFIFLAIGGSLFFAWNFFFDKKTDLDMARSKLASLTEYNEEWKQVSGHYFASKLELERQIPKESIEAWSMNGVQIFWTSEEVPINIAPHLSADQIPFLSADGYRTLMLINIKGIRYLILRNAGQVPIVSGELNK